MVKTKSFLLLIAVCVVFLAINGCTAKLNVPAAGENVVDPSSSTTEDTNGTQDSLPEGDNKSPQPDSEDAGSDGDQYSQPQDDDNDLENNDMDKDPEKTPDTDGEKSEQVVYVSASHLNVRSDATAKAEKIGQLMKGTAVRILEEKADDNNGNWVKVVYDSGLKETTGWISAQYTVADRSQLLSEKLKNLDFSPQPKVDEYPENPKVKVRGIYLTIYSASGSRLDKLIEMAKRTDINTFVIDVKDDKGNMLFHTKAAEKFAPDANRISPVKDIGALMKKLKENNIHTIARIVTFKDPIYTATHPQRAITNKRTGKPHSDRDGLPWGSPYDRQLWEYDVSVAKEAAQAGFNEIQFDYVRFPASNGGKLDKVLDYKNTRNETKPQAIQDFLKYAYKELSPYKVYIGADIYGLVGSVTDDMDLGQYWEAISNVVDYICPMMYPSHYANHTYGLPVPDAYPYETIFNSARDSVLRNKNIDTPAVIRPWIQDFTANWVKGYIHYGEKEVREQIRALKENGIDEYMLWNPNNRYTEAAVTNQ